MPGTTDDLWVGSWHSTRIVVYDPKIQPVSPELVFLYFVQGRQLCARRKDLDKPNVRTIKPHNHTLAARAQYRHWKSLQDPERLAQRCKDASTVDRPPTRGRRCEKCNGEGSWHYQVGTFSDGWHSDGQNFIERCANCSGSGSVDDVYEL